MLKRLLAIYLSVCLLLCCALTFVGCDGVSLDGKVYVQDGKYYCYNAVSDDYAEDELIEINGDKCTLTIKFGGLTVVIDGTITFAGNTFTVTGEYVGNTVAFSGTVEADGVLRVESQTVGGYTEAVIDYYCRKGKRPQQKPEQKYYSYDVENDEYTDYDVLTIAGSSCIWSFVDVFTTAVSEYKGTVKFSGDSFVINLSGSFTTEDSCIITYSGTQEKSGVLRVDKTVITVYSSLVNQPAVTTKYDTIYYCQKGSKPTVKSDPDVTEPGDDDDDDDDDDNNNTGDDDGDGKTHGDDDDDDDDDDSKPPEPPTKKIFLVTFDGNGGYYGDESSYTVYSDTVKEMPESLFYRAGYQFVGYNTKSDGSGTGVGVGETYEFTANVTFYAMWVRIYTVKFNFNSSSSSIKSVPDRKIAESAELGELSHPFSSANLCFTGWYDSQGKQYNSKSQVFSDLTLFAKWENKSIYDAYNAALPNRQQNGHIYVHFKSEDHLRCEEGKPAADSTVYGDLALWVYSHDQTQSRLFLPTAIDFGGMLFDIDVTKTYTDGGWDGENRTFGSDEACFNGHNLKVRVVRLSSVYNDNSWSFIGGNVSFYAPSFGPDKICNVFTDEFQVNRGMSSMGAIDGTYTPDLRLYRAPFSHY